MTLFLRTHPQDRRATLADEAAFPVGERQVGSCSFSAALGAIGVPRPTSISAGTASDDRRRGRMCARRSPIRIPTTPYNEKLHGHDVLRRWWRLSTTPGYKVSDGDSTGIVSITADGQRAGVLHLGLCPAGHWAHYSGPGGKVDRTTRARSPGTPAPSPPAPGGSVATLPARRIAQSESGGEALSSTPPASAEHWPVALWSTALFVPVGGGVFLSHARSCSMSLFEMNPSLSVVVEAQAPADVVARAQDRTAGCTTTRRR